MTLKELNIELQKLIGETVSFKRIAGNSIIIYFFGAPGDDSVASFFIDPAWRYEQQGKVLVGSYDFPFDDSDFKSKEEYQESFERRCSITDTLEGAKLEDIRVDLESSDILMKFSDGQAVRNFANSAFDAKAWTYRNRPHRLTAFVSPFGVRLRSEEDREV
jgi:hypothetical protein